MRPTSSGYLVDAASYNPVFDGARPAAIAYCASTADVAEAIRFSERHAVELSVRSGVTATGDGQPGPAL